MSILPAMFTLAATDWLELLCCQSKIWSRGMT